MPYSHDVAVILSYLIFKRESERNLYCFQGTTNFKKSFMPSNTEAHSPPTPTQNQDDGSGYQISTEETMPRPLEAAQVPRRGNSTTSSQLISLADLSWPLYHLWEIGAQVFRRPRPSTKRRLGPYNANSQSSKPKDTSSNPVKICPHQILDIYIYRERDIYI